LAGARNGRKAFNTPARLRRSSDTASLRTQRA
jgi:hypothetical protein